MPLNPSKGRMFKSVGWTWNPIAGCTHDCLYCWAKALNDKWKKPFTPAFRENYLKDKMPDDGSWIFVGSMGDTFCNDMPVEWVGRLLNYIAAYQGNNKFLLQTKNPRAFDFWKSSLENIKDKIILGTTIETTGDTTKFSKAPSTIERFVYLRQMKLAGFKTFLSLEPLAEFDIEMMKHWIVKINPEAIEIGLENYTSFTTKPSDEKIIELVHWIDSNGFNYVLKENLSWLSIESQQPEGKQ